MNRADHRGRWEFGGEMSEISEREREARRLLGQYVGFLCDRDAKGVLERVNAIVNAREAAVRESRFENPLFDQGVLQGRAECVAGPPQWEPPGADDYARVVWGHGTGDITVCGAHEVRKNWRDGDWCAPLRLPDPPDWLGQHHDRVHRDPGGARAAKTPERRG